MENKMTIGLIVTSFLAVGGLIFGIVSAKQTKTLKTELVTVKAQNQDMKRTQSNLHHELDRYQAALEKAQNSKKEAEAKVNNKDSHHEVYQQFNDQATKLMNVLYNYSPQNFGKRTENAKVYLTDKAYKEFFPSNVKYGDTSYVTSKISDIKVYNKTVQNDKLSGLVMVKYQSKYKDQAYNKGQAFYEVSYDTKARKVTNLKQVDNKMLSSGSDEEE